MKIGVLIGRQPPTYGGGFTYQESIIKGLLNYKGKHEFYFFYEDQPPFVEEGNERFIALNEKQTQSDLPVLSTLLLQYKIDVCWFLSSQFHFVHVPYIATVWDLEHKKHAFFPEVSQTGSTWEARETNYRHLFSSAAYIITGTQAGKEEIHFYYQIPKERIKVIAFPAPSWLAAYENQILPPSLFNITKPFLFYPAQFWPHKNHIVLLHVLKILHEKYAHDFMLVFTGSDMGNLEHIKNETRRLNLVDKVIFEGFVEREMVAFLYQHAFALLYPSFFGPDNLPPLEAFALGCPVLAASTFKSHEHLGDAVMLFDPRSEEEIAEKIHQLFLDPASRQALIAKGLAFSKQNGINGFVDEIEILLHEFERYRRTWDVEKLHRHFYPESDEAGRNVQYTLDEIYSNLMSYQRMKPQFELLQEKLKESEADRAARLEVIHEQASIIKRLSQFEKKKAIKRVVSMFKATVRRFLTG